MHSNFVHNLHYTWRLLHDCKYQCMHWLWTMSVPGQTMFAVIEDDAEFTLVTNLWPLGVKWVFVQGLNKLMWVLPERHNFGLFDVKLYKAFMPRHRLTCPGTCRVVSWGNSNGECEKVLLSVFPPVTGFVHQKQRPLIWSMHVPLPARYGWTEILALCIFVSPPFPSWLHSSTAQHPWSCAKTPPLQTKERAQHWQRWREWLGVSAPHLPNTQTIPMNNSNKTYIHFIPKISESCNLNYFALIYQSETSSH